MPHSQHPRPPGKKKSNTRPAVKISSIAVRAPAGASAPRRVRLFVNRPSLGFAEAEADPAAQEFELSAADVADGVPVTLRAHTFGRGVTQLAVFVADNQGGAETTQVSAIHLQGAAGETFNVAEIKKVGDDG